MDVSPSRDQRIQTVSLAIIATILGAAALYWLRPVMIPFILSLMLTYALAPVVDVLVRRARMPRWLGVLAAVLLGFFALFALSDLVSASFRDVAKNADAYQARLGEQADVVGKWLTDLGVPVDRDSLIAQAKKVPVGKTMAQLADTVLSLISNSFLVLIFAIYLLQSASRPSKAGSLLPEIEGRIKNYLFMKFVLSAATGVLTALILGVLGVGSAVVFGLLAFVLNFIPSVGSIVAVLLPLPLVLVDPNSTGLTIALCLILPAAVQLVIGNVIEPKWMGDSLQLHPITILLGLVFWGMLWGVPGMLLATPLCAALRIVLDAFDETRPLARLLSGQILKTESEQAPTQPSASEST